MVATTLLYNRPQPSPSSPIIVMMTTAAAIAIRSYGISTTFLYNCPPPPPSPPVTMLTTAAAAAIAICPYGMKYLPLQKRERERENYK